MPARSLEIIHPLGVGIERRVLVAHRIDHNIEFEVLTRSALQSPNAFALIVRLGDLGSRRDMRVQTKVCRAFLEIGLDLRLVDVARGPIWIRRVGKGV